MRVEIDLANLPKECPSCVTLRAERDRLQVENRILQTRYEEADGAHRAAEDECARRKVEQGRLHERIEQLEASLAAAEQDQERAVEQVNAIRNAEIEMFTRSLAAAQQELKELITRLNFHTERQAHWEVEAYTAQQELSALRAEVAAIQPYLQHKTECHLSQCEGTHHVLSLDKHVCTCGLANRLLHLGRRQEPEKEVR